MKRDKRFKLVAKAPLFGQPWGVGVFFVPAHKRGKRNVGIAEKDYAVQVGVA